MGYDAHAVGVVGICLSPGVIKDRLYTEEKVRGCEHLIYGEPKFCPECGKERLKTVHKAIPEYDEDCDEPTLCGYRLVHRGEGHYDDPEFIAYHWTELLGRRQVKTILMDTLERLPAIREEMQAKLAPLGLFDDNAFGVHVFLYESC